MVSEPKRPDAGQPPPQPTRRGNVVALIAVAALALLLFFTVSAMQKHNAVQACIDSGRRDCVALPTD